MGFVFQQMNVLANLNMIDNVVLPALHAKKSRKRELYRRARALMDDFHIGDLAERRVNEVSGGQLQRACICRSLMMEPEIIFADEPTGALNQAAAADVIEAFLQKQERRGV
jgi:putative ABC transport system ATP-binding protein